MTDYDFTEDELEYMREVQVGHMMDSCVIQTHSATYDTFGQEILSYTDGSEIRCGLDMRPGSERHGQDETVLTYDATLRLPITTTLTEKDRIKVTKRFGEDWTDLVFEVVGVLQRGASGLRVLLRRIEL